VRGSTPKFLKYPYGIITGLKIGRDSKVQTVTARMSDRKLCERDITKIALIDRNDEQ